ncbi:MAG: hypothetical protein F4186_01710 [Boseongicola sp. SB0676_bin_33]|uniref:DUF6036 domain-containing protein n=1 Tax=Boseongicola sp. SB0664_bin_43 TaxID=2604844 RepID=A0A6B0XWL8_9RHOB|nr:hypothetical protein [Boseongicola sp. SB0664_bin_43]MYF88203.1 hypothetical protein [Boseongicola sp. SB0676_bin_33]MYK32670.1 hypothetical protein [Boseongicola sp. SB0670_bin_30]
MIDRDRLQDILSAIGRALRNPARLTLIGSAASILSGQDGRHTPGIDVWRPASDFDAEDFRNACEKAGILHDPKGPIGDEDEYIQIVRPGIVSLPNGFRTTEIDRYGHLVVERPPVELIVASKLSRGSETDLEDAAWWVANTGLSLRAVEKAISELPRKTDRETADENLVFLKLSHSGED